MKLFLPHKYSICLVAFAFAFGILARGQLAPEFEKRLASGDPTTIESLTKSASIDELYSVLMLALHRQFAAHSDQIRSITIAALRRFPDHAQRLGDKIDALSESRGTAGKRERAFYLLQSIASPEAVAQIGRFLFDERNPEKGLAINDGTFEVPNSHWAANAMGMALGNKIGAKQKPGFYGPDEVKSWQTWWQSPAADTYKTASAHKMGMPPIISPPMKPRTNEVEPASSSESPDATPWLVWLVIIGAALGLLWLVLKRRAK